MPTAQLSSDMPSTDVHRIGIVTGEVAPDLSDDGQKLQSVLQARGFDVEPVVWDESSVEWATYDVLVVRSCWHYHIRPAQFRAWLETVDALDVVVLNPPNVCRWNMHKFYLRELEEAGVPVIPTEYVDRGSDVDLDALLERRGWTDAVVKPAVGTSADGVWRVTAPVGSDAIGRFQDHRSKADLLVQRFVPEIARGELSFVFFGGAYCHAFRSVPTTGDFRAHPNFGGTVEPLDPAPGLEVQAREVVSSACDLRSMDPASLAYARVDGVELAGEFTLMELELIEPYLGIGMSDGALDPFAETIVTTLRRRTNAPRGS